VNANQNSVSVINTATGKVTGSPIPVGEGPVAIAINPYIPFGSMSSQLAIYPYWPRFQLHSYFTLGSGAAWLDPATLPITIQIGTYGVTIPPGSFIKAANGSWSFAGTIKGVDLSAKIWIDGTKQYAFVASGAVKIPGLKNPMTTRVTIGPDSGTQPVIASITP
jgi:YVTN family beta-propeller protein